MRTRKCNPKKANKENENIDKVDCGQDKNSPSSRRNDFDAICNPLFIATREEMASPKKEMNNNLILPDISTKEDDADLILVAVNTTNNKLPGRESSVGQKRSIEEVSHLNDHTNNEMNLIQIKKKCLEIEERLNHLEMTWMLCPEHLLTVQNDFSGISQTANGNNSVLVHNDEMFKAIETLNIDLDILIKLKKKTSTATARSILKYKFPNPAVNFKLTDVDETLVDAIALYSKQSHPNDTSTISKIRRAMSNYFALHSYKKKIKLSISNPSIDEQEKKFSM